MEYQVIVNGVVIDTRNTDTDQPRRVCHNTLNAAESDVVVFGSIERPLTFRDVAKECRAMGFLISRDSDGEMRLAPDIRNKAKQERRAYYSSDLSDILGTARLEHTKADRRDKLNKTQRVARDWCSVES